MLLIAVVVSLSFSLFQDFGQLRPKGEPYSVTAVSFGSKTETTSNLARNFGWANYKDTRTGTNLILFSSNLKAILYSQSPGEVVTPGHMRNVVVFRGKRAKQSPVPTGKLVYHETRRGAPPASPPQAPQDLPASSNVVPQVSTREQTASDTTTYEVDRDVSGQPIAPSSKAGQQQLSTAEICPRDPSNCMSSTQLQAHAAAPSPNVFQSHDYNAIVGDSQPSHESLPASVDSTDVLCRNGNGNGAIGLDSSLRGLTAKRAEESTAARESCANGTAAYDRGQLSLDRGRCGSLSGFVFLLLLLLSLLPSPFSFSSLLYFFKAHYGAP